MIILSNGYKLPETGDFGSIWFPALEDNIQRTNDHTHNGLNSSKIPSSSVEAVVQQVLSGAFSLVGDMYETTITVAGGTIDIDKKHVIFRDPTTKEPLYLKYTKVSASQIKIYTNIALDVEVLTI